MYDSFHSGIEGYCKMAAKMLGEPNNTTGWLPFCRDILPDRAQKNLTRVWTFSNDRNQGRSCRQSLFENQWLEHVRTTYEREAELLARGERPVEGFRTIEAGGAYERQILSSKSTHERRRLVRMRYERDALRRCVAHMVRKAASYDGSQTSCVSLVYVDDFPAEFFRTVIPAIERGFVSERYHPSAARQFSITINDLLTQAQAGLLRENPNYVPFGRLVTALFAGLVYGPNHPIATGKPWNATEHFHPYRAAQRVDGVAIRVTQVFDPELAYEGYSEVYRPEQAVFFGRSAKLEDFLAACRRRFGDNRPFLKEISTREAIMFPIAESHEAVGNVHGMLLCEGDVWRFYDFGSTNGTSIQSRQGSQGIDGTMTVRPGDLVRLGAPSTADDANVFWSAAVMHVSHYVERERELYA